MFILLQETTENFLGICVSNVVFKFYFPGYCFVGSENTVVRSHRTETLIPPPFSPLTPFFFFNMVQRTFKFLVRSQKRNSLTMFQLPFNSKLKYTIRYTLLILYKNATVMYTSDEKRTSLRIFYVNKMFCFLNKLRDKISRRIIIYVCVIH